eukprot:symbB.v1.2.033828.t1/scaffold4257.1/size42297/2
MSAMFCETSAVLITVLLGGRFLETLAKTKTTQAVHQISAKRPKTAKLLETLDGPETDIHYDLLQMGDLLRVLPGEQVPVDGEVISDGTVYCDESLLTGEAAPVRKQRGSQVVFPCSFDLCLLSSRRRQLVSARFAALEQGGFSLGVGVVKTMGAGPVMSLCNQEGLELGKDADMKIYEQVAVDEFTPMETTARSELQKDRINPWSQLDEGTSILQCCGPDTAAPQDIVADSMGTEVIVDQYSYRVDPHAVGVRRTGHALR